MKMNKTQYNFKDKCPYCGEPITGRMTFNGFIKRELHTKDCKRLKELRSIYDVKKLST